MRRSQKSVLVLSPMSSIYIVQISSVRVNGLVTNCAASTNTRVHATDSTTRKGLISPSEPGSRAAICWSGRAEKNLSASGKIFRSRHTLSDELCPDGIVDAPRNSSDGCNIDRLMFGPYL